MGLALPLNDLHILVDRQSHYYCSSCKRNRFMQIKTESNLSQQNVQEVEKRVPLIDTIVCKTDVGPSFSVRPVLRVTCYSTTYCVLTDGRRNSVWSGIKMGTLAFESCSLVLALVSTTIPPSVCCCFCSINFENTFNSLSSDKRLIFPVFDTNKYRPGNMKRGARKQPRDGEKF